MPYRIKLRPAARRDLKKLPPEVLRRLRPKIDALAGNPRPAGVKALSTPEKLHRVRVGDYRIVYTVDDKALLVLVARIRHRREVYRKR